MKFRALKMQIIKYLESIIFLFVPIIIIYEFIRNFEILFDYNFYYNEFTLIGKIIMPIFMILVIYIMIFAIEYSIVIIIRFTNSYIKITNDYIELNVVKVINSQKKFPLIIEPTFSASYGFGKYRYMSRRGSYGAYVGILKKVKYKIKISDIKRVGYLKDFGIKSISSYPVADDPLNIVIETNNNKYFIPNKQFTKKQMKKMYEEINKRQNKN